MEREFQTKLGKCVIDPEKLILTRHGVTGTIARKTIGESISRLFVIDIVLSIASLVIGIISIQNQDYLFGGFAILLCGIFIWNVITSRKNSGTNHIERNEIDKITIHDPHPPFTRGYITVHFLRDGKNQKRFIMFPGNKSGGKEEFQRALKVLHQTGWDNLISPS